MTATVIAGAVLLRRRSTTSAPTAVAPDLSRSTIAPATPMVGLEAALDQVTDRTGRKLRDKLEDEAGIVADLRTPDDTGPVLRRALDRVEHHDPHATEPT